MFRIGAAATDNPASIKCCYAQVTQLYYDSFETPDGTDYVVPVGKTLHISRIMFTSSGANEPAEIGYGDVGVNDQAAAPAGAVIMVKRIMVNTAANTFVYDVNIQIPEGKYPFLHSGAGSQGMYMVIFGIEV